MIKIVFIFILISNLCFASTFYEAEKAYQKKDYKTAFEIFSKLPNQDAPKVQFYLGIMYSKGLYVKQDYKKAKDFLEKSAYQGNAKAQYLLAEIYLNGRGVNKNMTIAKELMEMAAMQDYTLAQYILGMIYVAKDSKFKDYNEAIMWFEIACKKGHMQSCKYFLDLKEDGY